MEIRFTTRIALAFLIAIIFGLTIYAYPSWPGFVTLVFRAAAIVGAIAIVVLLIAALTRRRPGRLDLLLLLSAVGLVVASWPQISAVADFNTLEREIEAAGEENAAAVIAATETTAGILVRSAEMLRATANAGIDELLGGLWPEDVVALIDGPDAADAAAVAGAVDRLAGLRLEVEEARGAAEAIIDAEVAAIPAIETPLPDSARLVFVDAAIQRAEADRIFYLARFGFADARLVLAEAIVALLAGNAGAYHFNAATERVQFDDREIAIDYEERLTEIDATMDTEAELVDGFAAEENPRLLALVEAAGATP
jgi:hypothetical protein